MAKKSQTDQQIATMRALTQGSAAWMANLSERHLRTTDCPRQADGSYSAQAVAAWLAERAAASAGADLPAGDSPNLERYRAAKADLAEMEAAERRGELIPTDKNRAFLGRVAAILRQAGDVIASFDPEAHRVLDEARQEHQDGRKAARDQKRADDVAECQEMILGAMNAIPNHREVLSRIREATGRKGKVFDEAFAVLVRTGKMRPSKIQRANGQDYDGYERVYPEGKPPEKDMSHHQEELSLGHSADSLGDPAD